MRVRPHELAVAMVILRPTRALRALPVGGEPRATSDTALGDRYIGRASIDRQPTLLLVSSTSLLSIVLPARDGRALPDRLAEVAARRLRRLAVASAAIDAEASAMRPVLLAPTANRSVLGILVEFSKLASRFVGDPRSERGLAELEDRLGDVPCHAASARTVVFPSRRAQELLRARWLPASPGTDPHGS